MRDDLETLDEHGRWAVADLGAGSSVRVRMQDGSLYIEVVEPRSSTAALRGARMWRLRFDEARAAAPSATVEYRTGYREGFADGRASR